MDGVRILGAHWERDSRAFDPCAQIRRVEIDGRVFEAHNLLGPGWPMTVRPAAFDGWSVTVGWERWTDVATAVRAHYVAH